MSALVHGPFFGCYCDGGSARSLPVNVEVDADLRSLVIEGELLLSYWDLASVAVEELPGDDLLRLTRLDSNEQLLLANSTPVRRALDGARWRALPNGRWSAIVGRLAALLVAIVGAGVLVPTLAALLGPTLRPLVDVLWVDAETLIGTESNRDDVLQAELAGLTARLGSPGIGFRFSPSLDANAYATTRGDIVLTRGLLCDVEDPGELAGLVAHELAHVERGHSSIAALRGVLGRAVLFALTDQVSFSLPALALNLVEKWQARIDETVADVGAADRLNAARISSEWIVNFFQRHDEGPLGGTILSDHPALSDRADYFLQRGDELTVEALPALSPASWEALRAKCARP